MFINFYSFLDNNCSIAEATVSMSDISEEFSDLKHSMRFPPSLRSVDDFIAFVTDQAIVPAKPEHPIFNSQTSFVSMGSCFSTNIADALERLGLNIKNFFLSERLFTTFALRDFLADFTLDASNSVFLDEFPENQAAVEDITTKIKSGSLIILTLGLSVCWFHRSSGEFKHRVVSLTESRSKDSDREKLTKRLRSFEMRATSVEENVAALTEAISIIRSLNPKNTVLLSVSPVPIHWWQSEKMGLLSGDFISKATLMLAVRAVIERGYENVHYFPSFEIVRWACPHLPGDFWGSNNTDGNPRHLDSELVRLLLHLFFKYYGGIPEETWKRV